MKSKKYIFIIVSIAATAFAENNKTKKNEDKTVNVKKMNQENSHKEIVSLIENSIKEINITENINSKKDIINILEYFKISMGNNLLDEDNYQRLMDILSILPDKVVIDNPVYTNVHDRFEDMLKIMYEKTAHSIPKNIHFIWIGSKLNDIQSEYIKLWAKLNPDYEVSVWYDSNAFYANEVKNEINGHIHEELSRSGTTSNNYNDVFAEKTIEIQNSLYRNIMNSGINDFDLVKINFLKNKIHKNIGDYETLKNEKINYIKNKKKEFSSADGNIVFKDIQSEINSWGLKNHYEKEINLRMNFAAASDLFRTKIGNKYGGIYFDVDIFPSLKSSVFFLDNDPILLNEIKKNRSLIQKINLAFTESILNENVELRKIIRSRVNKSSENINNLIETISLEISKFSEDLSPKVSSIPQKIIEASVNAKNLSIHELFFNLGDIKVRKGQFKTATEINNVIACHPSRFKTDWMRSVEESIKTNYRLIEYIHSGTSGKKSELIDKITMIGLDEVKVSNSILYYRYDGILANSKSTITISGPGAYNRFLEARYGKYNLIKSYFKNIRWFERRNYIFNNNTEEDLVSSWVLKEIFIENNVSTGLPKQIIMEIGNQNNVKKAAMILYRSGYNRIEEGIYKIGLAENQLLSSDLAPVEVNNEIRLQIVANTSIEQVNENKVLKIGGFKSDDLAIRIANQFKWGKNEKLKISHINILSNIYSDENSALISSFFESFLKKLEEFNISSDKLYFRTNLSRTTEFGQREFYDFHSGNLFHTDSGKNLYFTKNYDNKISMKKYPSFSNSEISDVESNSKSNFTFPDEEFININNNSLNLFMRYIGNSAEALKKSSEFEKTIWRITKENRLSNAFVPLLHSIDSKWNAIKFFNPLTRDNYLILLEQNDFNIISDFKDFFEKNIKNMAKNSNKNLAINRNNLSGYIGGLNEGLAIKAIFDYLGRKKSDNIDQNNKDLSDILKAHACLNLAQLSIGFIEDANQMTRMFSALSHVMKSKDVMGKYFDPGTSALTKANMILTATNVVLDSLEIMYAKKASDKIIFTTQLGFDSLGLALAGGSFALSLLGQSAAASSLGILFVPFAGLSIGFNSFAGAAAGAQEESIHSANYFLKYQKSHDNIGLNTFNHENNGNKILSLTHSKIIRETNNQNPNEILLKVETNPAIVKEIDLSETDKIKLSFGTNYLFKTERANEGWWFSGFGVSPRPITYNCNNYKESAIPVREHLDIDEKKQLYLNENVIILLPNTPEACISYHYGYTPGIVSRNDAELVPIRKLQQKGGVLFEYMVGLFEFAIRGLSFEYKKTNIEVNLGVQDQILITPPIPMEWKNKITYTLAGNNGNYTLALSNNATYYIKSQRNEKWIFDARNIYSDIVLEKNKLIVGNSLIYFEGTSPDQVLVKDFKNNIIDLNPQIANQKIIEINEESYTDIDLFKKLLTEISHDIDDHHGKYSYIKIDNHKTNEGQITNAWYDVKNRKFLYPKFSTGVNYNTSEIQLIGVNDNQVYYYCPSNNEILYQLNPDSSVTSLATEIKHAYFKDGFIFAEHKDGFLLMLENPTKKFLIQVLQSNANIEFLLNNKYLKNNNIDLEKFIKIVNYKLEPVGWFINKQNSFTRVNLNSSNSRNLDLVGYISSLIENEPNSYFYFDHDSKILKRQKGENGILEEISLKDISYVITIGYEPLAFMRDGAIYHFNLNGEAKLVGLNHEWSEQNKNDDLKFVVENILTKTSSHSEVIFLISKKNYGLYNIKSKTLFELFK